MILIVFSVFGCCLLYNSCTIKLDYLPLTLLAFRVLSIDEQKPYR